MDQIGGEEAFQGIVVHDMAEKRQVRQDQQSSQRVDGCVQVLVLFNAVRGCGACGRRNHVVGGCEGKEGTFLVFAVNTSNKRCQGIFRAAGRRHDVNW